MMRGKTVLNEQRSPITYLKYQLYKCGEQKSISTHIHTPMTCVILYTQWLLLPSLLLSVLVHIVL